MHNDIEIKYSTYSESAKKIEESERTQLRLKSEDMIAPRILSKKESLEIVKAALGFAGDSGHIKIAISSWWGGGQRWARNMTSMSSDQREVTVKIERLKNGGLGTAETNQIDLESLKGVVSLAEYYATLSERNNPSDRVLEQAKWTPAGSDVWSNKTFDANILDSASAIERLTQKATDELLLSAGNMTTNGSTALIFSRDESGRINEEWGEVTEASCSMTIRHPKGLGSGSAARTSFDISNINVDTIASLAFDKCKASLNPVRIEPGRYTAILEPSAVAELFKVFVWNLRRRPAESGREEYPIFGGYDPNVGRFLSKLGWKIVDERINLYHDPQDPLVGTHRAKMVARVDLITKGVLTGTFNDYSHELVEKSGMFPNISRASFRVDGTSTTTDEMIRSTKRGLLVSKFAGVNTIDGRSLLSTGFTRDGVWLIENGAISKSVRNFRWIESPIFAFNNIEQIGIEEPVSNINGSRAPLISSFYGFHDAQTNIVVPTMKVKDFNFSSLIDAI